MTVTTSTLIEFYEVAKTTTDPAEGLAVLRQAGTTFEEVAGLLQRELHRRLQPQPAPSFPYWLGRRPWQDVAASLDRQGPSAVTVSVSQCQDPPGFWQIHVNGHALSDGGGRAIRFSNHRQTVQAATDALNLVLRGVWQGVA